MERTAKPFAARVCPLVSVYVNPAFHIAFEAVAHNHTVVPGEDSQFIQPSDEVPTRGDVAS